MSVEFSLPRYKCHKEVRALKIANIETDGEIAAKEGREATAAGATLSFVENGYTPVYVDAKWRIKHEPHAGGYYVIYEDGYKSFSPAEAFEGGYTRL